MTDIKQQTFQTLKKNCHTGNTTVYTEKNGGTLMIGGWNQGAAFNHNTYVIDLTGTEHKYWDVPVAFDEIGKKFLPHIMKAYAGWLSLPFPDFGTPAGMSSYSQWLGVAQTIKEILQGGNDVLVACHGGHGRSGLFVSIVGYILHDGKGDWHSPVENLRKIHCDEAVETFKQEKYVYDILGLDIRIDRTQYEVTTGGSWNTLGYNNLMGATTAKFIPCPICGTQSANVADFGLCKSCEYTYKDAPETTDLTTAQIEGKGEVPHKCNNDGCFGIWRASVCKHIVHDQVIVEGYCEPCWLKVCEEAEFAEKKLNEIPATDELCAVCGKNTTYTFRFGICYECQERLEKVGAVDVVHNSITDAYRFVVHNCEDETNCVGIVQADGCNHIVHNREIEDGLCPACLKLKTGKEVE